MKNNEILTQQRLYRAKYMLNKALLCIENIYFELNRCHCNIYEV